jgi:hypothetical protein
MISAIVLLAGVGGCIGDRAPTEQQPVTAPKGPLFDHVGGPVPTVDVDVNNYLLSLTPDLLWNSAYKGASVLYAGELAYGNAPDAAFFYNASGRATTPRLQGTVLPIEVAIPPFADHRTVSLLIEKTAGGSRSLGLVVVRETFAFRDPPDDDYVILKYTLYNARAAAVENLHVGQILDTDLDIDPDDPDLGSIFDNTVEYTTIGDFALVRSTVVEESPVAGHAMLGLPTTSYHPFGNPSSPGGGFTDPGTTAEWFGVFSGGIVSPSPYGPGDIRHALSHGPVTVRGGEGETFAFVVAGGDDVEDLNRNIAAARARYRALPREALRPYPVIAVGVTIEPWPIDPAVHTEFAATLRGVPRKLVPLFDQNRTYCGVPPLPSSPATTLTPRRDGVRATFPIANVPPNGLRPGDEIICAGRLTDGTLFAGRPTPTPLPVAPASQLTAIGVNRAPTWSPDGSAIAFSSNRSGTSAIWRMNVAAGEASAVQLTDGPDDHAADWFGSTIAFARGPDLTAGEIYSVSDAGGAITLINADGRNPRYSPDGTTLAFTRVTDDFHLWTMPSTGGGEAQITAGGLDFHPEWSPDGSEIYFTAFSDGLGAIFRVAAVGGAPVRVTPDEGTDNRHAALSPDGKWLAFTSGRQCPFGVVLVLQERATGDHTVVPLDPSVCAGPVTGADVNQNLEFSPDGTRLVFAAGGHIWVADLSAVIP